MFSNVLFFFFATVFLSASVLGFLCTYSPILMEDLAAEWQKAKLWEVHGEYFKEHAGHLWGTRINNSDSF